MFRKIVFILITLLHCSAMIQSAERRSTVELYNFTCFKYTNLIKSLECDLQQFGVSHYGLSARALLDRDLGRNTQVRVWIDTVPKISQRSIRVADTKLNACSFIKNIVNNPFLKKVVVGIKKTSNLLDSCPFKGNFTYTLENFNITSDLVSSVMPVLNFSCNVEVFENNKRFAGWQILGAKIA